MPITEFDLIMGGMKDFRMDDLKISVHARKRCKERNIPLEDLRRSRKNINGIPIIKGHTVVTAINKHEHVVSTTSKKATHIFYISCDPSYVGRIMGKKKENISEIKKILNINFEITYEDSSNCLRIQTYEVADEKIIKPFLTEYYAVMKISNNGTIPHYTIIPISDTYRAMKQDEIASAVQQYKARAFTNGDNLYLFTVQKHKLEKLIKILT
jgi:predicted PilT family ATPase